MKNYYEQQSTNSLFQTMLPGEEISTIFVVGFPENTQEREFQNMFLFSPGFEAATLKVPTQADILEDNGRKQIIGFARFRTRLEAFGAREILNGKRIDQEKGNILKAEMAKKNLHITSSSKSIKTPYEAFHSVPHNIIPTRSCSFNDYSLLGRMGNKKASTVYPQQGEGGDDLILSQLIVSTSTPNLYDNRSSSIINIIDQNPPCNTLYVGNLPINTNQDELVSMFCKCPGYKRLSFLLKSNGPMCFVEFEDISSATIALKSMHGNPLSNSIHGGIRLSFSKNPLGVRQTTVH